MILTRFFNSCDCLDQMQGHTAAPDDGAGDRGSREDSGAGGGRGSETYHFIKKL